MIDFRYHIVSLIAVFLALALGLFLGSTTLQSTVTNNLHHQADRVTAENKQLGIDKQNLSNELKASRGFIAGISSYSIDNRLPGDSVAVVSAPGVSSDDRQAAEATLTEAGASITVDVQLTPAYFDPTQDEVLGGLASALKLPGHPLPTGNGATEASSRLAAVLTATTDQKAVSKVHVEATLEALADGKFISISGDPPTHPASLAVLLLPAPSASLSSTTAQTQNAVLLALATQLSKTTSGLVIAGPTVTPTVSDGTLAAVGGDSALSNAASTVDFGTDQQDPDHVAGRVGMVLALADAASGHVGSYGLGETPPVPTPSPVS